ncbi:MAG: CHAP domain-containing protein [Chloroflexi bacterium]|nr:MAG: CHAP domain-containing protein [Chloroflexota bacterium]TME46251.1 MAG: CHAP domain-containing protein [Chloroflexota bacterium]
MVGERLKWRKALSALMGATVLLFGIPAITVSAAGVDDYPYRGHANMLDPWGFYTGYCTSFVAFRLTQEGVSFHGASLRGPNGKTAFFGNGGTWDSAAAAIGYAVNSTPTVGSVAVWHGGEGGAWSGGHVAYVMAVDGAGNATVEEYNWSNYLRYGQRTTRAPRYIHFVGVATVRPISLPTPGAPAQPAGHAYRTTDVVRERSGPGTGYGTRAILPAGTRIMIVCQVRSSSVIRGTGIWDRLRDGGYVTDYYTTTPAFNTFSPGIPRC